MKILAFESSAKAAGVALIEDGTLLAESFQNTALTHSRTLMQMAEDMLRNCELTADDIDTVAVAAGPGSFTGVRIGVAAAKGFAWGKEIPCCGVSTLEAMVLGAAMTDGVYCACMDARRNQFYNAVFAVENGKVERMTEDRAIDAEELREELKKTEKTVFLVGDGAALCYNLIAEGLPHLRLLPEHLRQQRASGVALAAYAQVQSGAVCSAEELTPNYLRLSQAERERAEKQKTESK